MNADQVDFRGLIDGSLDLFCVANTDGYFYWLNDAWQPTLGWTDQEMKSRPFTAFVHPDDLDRSLVEMGRLAQGEKTVQFVNRYRHKDGGWRSLEWNATPFPDGRLYCSARDITRRAREEHELKEKVGLLEMTEHMGQIGYWRVDLRNERVAWSRQSQRILGFDGSQEWHSIKESLIPFHPEDRPNIFAFLDRARQGSTSFKAQLRLLRQDESVRLIHAVGRLDPARPGFIFGVMQDVTERFTELRRSNQALDEFAYAAAHDLQAPLKTIRGLADLLKHDADPGDEATAMLLDRIVDSSQHMQRLIKELYEFARLTGSDGSFEHVDLADLVTTAAGLLEEEIASSGASVETVDLPRILGRRAPLTALFQNLISNSIKYRHPDRAPRIVIDSSEAGDRLAVSVSDNGIGFDPKYSEKVLRPFSRLSHERADSLGMGLATCARVARMHGGRMEVWSEPGQGSRFTLVLPAAARI